jgi:anthranilate/para-aminobenzoate synthase component II
MKLQSSLYGKRRGPSPTVSAWVPPGVSLDVFVEGVGVPVLGVCLGMQALAYANGAAVVRGPEPVHGRLSIVRHSGHRLFSGIPSGALCVRRCLTWNMGHRV